MTMEEPGGKAGQSNEYLTSQTVTTQLHSENTKWNTILSNKL